jgi:DNA primase
METDEIRSRLTLSGVLHHYGLKAGKQQRLHCPFHEDTSCSLQLHYKTQTACCLSPGCQTADKKLDVIDFILYKENCSRSEAIEKAKAMISGGAKDATMLSREEFLLEMFTYFRNAVHNSAPAKAYLKHQGLDHTRLEIGYNSGQFHHGSRKDETLIENCLQVGLLLDKGQTNSRTGEKAYSPFGKQFLVFALRDRHHRISGLYFHSIANEAAPKNLYLKDPQGLYPHYPDSEAKHLILATSVPDAARLLMSEEISASYCVLACDRHTEELREAMCNLPQLEEIIFFSFAGDVEDMARYRNLLQEQLPGIRFSTAGMPDKEHAKHVLNGQGPDALLRLIENRSALVSEPVREKLSLTPTAVTSKGEGCQLNTENPHNILFSGLAAIYAVKGGVKSQLDSLKISLQVISGHRDYRCKLDLYEYRQVASTADTIMEALGHSRDQTEQDLMLLASLLESYREQYLQKGQTKQAQPVVRVPEARAKECIRFMQQQDLLNRFNELIGTAGVVGEEENRLFLFVLATSYKMPEPLHGLIQGSSGSGKTRLLKIVSMLMPPEDVKRFTRVTQTSFYNYGEYDLQHKLLCFEDVDGLKEEAQLALRELQSNDVLISSTSTKSEDGHIRSTERMVKGPIASLACTTKGDYYEDNISRCFLVAVDESREQTRRVISYQNCRAAGETDDKQEQGAVEFVQNCVRLLQPSQVINLYATKVELPEEAHKIRRLNEMYQSIVRQVTLLNQYRRNKDGQGRLITEKEDMRTACDILFESIVLKVDELDGSLRQFFEQLKGFVQMKGSDYEFNRFEVRAATGVSKTQQHRYLHQLVRLEYVQQFGFANRGYKYRITYWDDMEAIRERVKSNLVRQLDNL